MSGISRVGDLGFKVQGLGCDRREYLGLSGGRFGLWGLRFGISLWGSWSLRVNT